MRPKEFGPICRRYVDVSTISLYKNLSVMGDGSKLLVSMVQHYGRPQSDISSHSHNMKRRILIKCAKPNLSFVGSEFFPQVFLNPKTLSLREEEKYNLLTQEILWELLLLWIVVLQLLVHHL